MRVEFYLCFDYNKPLVFSLPLFLFSSRKEENGTSVVVKSCYRRSEVTHSQVSEPWCYSFPNIWHSWHCPCPIPFPRYVLVDLYMSGGRNSSCLEVLTYAPTFSRKTETSSCSLLSSNQSFFLLVAKELYPHTSPDGLPCLSYEHLWDVGFSLDLLGSLCLTPGSLP